MKTRNLNIVWLTCLTMLILNLITFSNSCAQNKTFAEYKSIDLQHDKLFVEYFNKFKTLVRRNDRNGLARLFDNNYPKLLVLVDSENRKLNKFKEVIIRNRSGFVRYYPQIFDKRMRNLIHDTKIQDLELMEGGIKLGIGQVWWLYDVKKKEIRLSYLANYQDLF